MMTQAEPRTMDGYIRISRRMGREGPGYIAPKIQREAITRWAEYRGVTIAAWHEDEDESGGTQDRPGLRAAIDRAINGETAGIVSWKIDRFSRFTEGGLRDLRRLEDAGARLAFVVEDIDTGGPMGKFVYTVMLAMGEYFLGNIKAGWIVTKSRANGRGVHIGPIPFGYLANDDGTLKVDPERGPIVTEAFAIAARDDNLAGTIAFLRQRAPERTWTTFTTRRFLANKTYLGNVYYGEEVCHDSHPALVTRSIFEVAQHDAGAPRAPSGDFPLSGIAACGSCGGRIIGGRGGTDKRRIYRCADRCAQPPVISAEPLEAHVIAEIRAAFEHPGFRIGSTTASADVTAAEKALLEAEHELDEFAADLTARKMLGDRYHPNLERRVNAVDEARRQLREAMSETTASQVVVPAELWDDLEPAELAEVLRAGLDRIIIRRGRGPLAERVTVVPKGLDRPALASPQDA